MIKLWSSCQVLDILEIYYDKTDTKVISNTNE